ncbi:MAG: transporter [Pseudomonadales bacterium]|jgi:hypothetical protein
MNQPPRASDLVTRRHPCAVRRRAQSAALALAVIVFASVAAANAAAAASDAGSLAKAVQNPVADMISVPFQNNTNFDAGPLEKTQNVLNIQPVYPFGLNDDWNVITRTIVPVISQPPFTSAQDREFGVGDIQFSAFLSPKQATGDWVWGAGMIAQLNTATDNRLGQDVWGLGPTAVALRLGTTWVYGALLNNVWSVAKKSGAQDVNQMLVQPFVNYNFPNHPGRYLSFAPIITANWEADGGQKWTVPLGLGIGQVMRFGNQPINVQVAGYYNVERPDYAARWQLRLQLQLLFPK